jgi:hypothetical protein
LAVFEEFQGGPELIVSHAHRLPPRPRLVLVGSITLVAGCDWMGFSKRTSYKSDERR